MNNHNYKIPRDGRIHAAMGEFMRAGRLHRSVFEKTVTKKIGIHHSQHILLMIISHNENQTQKALAEKMEVSPAAVAVTLRKLEESGYVERNTGAYDHRANTVSLSEKGMETARITDEMFSANDREIFDGFTDREIDDFCAYLQRVKANLIKMNEKIEE